MLQLSSVPNQEGQLSSSDFDHSSNTVMPEWHAMDHQLVVRSIGQDMEGRITGTNGKRWEFQVSKGFPLRTGQQLLFQLTTPFSRFEEEGVIQQIHHQPSEDSKESSEVLSVYFELTLPLETLKRTFPQPGDAELNTPLSSCILQLSPLDAPTDEPEKEAIRREICRASPLTSTTFHLPSRSQDPVDICSTLVHCRNERGETIAGYHDYPRLGLPEHSPVVVLMPGYGETKREYVTLAHYLANNGFHVVRYDHTNHVGESDGDHECTTLSRMRGDLQAVLRFVERTWSGSPVALVATSLAGRVAIKEISVNRHVGFLFLIAGIIDVRATLHAVHQEDLVGHYLQGIPQGITNVLGFNVDLDQWMADAVQQNYADMSSTLTDIAQVSVPTVCFYGGEDAWIEPSAKDRLFASVPSHRIHKVHIPDAMHRLLENPGKARLVYRQIVERCQAQFGIRVHGNALIEPSKRAIGLQKRIERERNKARMAEMNLAEFWKDYLDHFHYIKNLSDYHQLLDHIADLLGPVRSGERVLDAGCGNGNFGMYLQARLKSQFPQPGRQPVHYVGADLVPTALHHAQGLLRHVVHSSQGTGQNDLRLFNPAFTSTNLNSPLPFRDGQFDKIVCNLVLGYLENPEQTLREFIRVLAPNGRLVLTNLKPNADLSKIYQNFVERTSNRLEVEEGRQLLNNSGKIRHAEENGVFHFHEQEELAAIMARANGGATPEMYSTFANQAFIAVMVKHVQAQISTLEAFKPRQCAA